MGKHRVNRPEMMNDGKKLPQRIIGCSICHKIGGTLEKLGDNGAYVHPQCMKR